MNRQCFPSFLSVPLILLWTTLVPVQEGGGHILFGDVTVTRREEVELRPMTLQVILYGTSGNVIARQAVPLNGRYRFMSIRNGEYYLAVEMEDREITRLHLILTMLRKMEIRRDVHLEWREDTLLTRLADTAAPPGEDFYQRGRENAQLWQEALEAGTSGADERAIDNLRRITASDDKDYQAWAELGSLLHNRDNVTEAEHAYRQALSLRPSYSRAVINYGRLRMAQKDYEGAIELLSRAIQLKPESADAHFLLGEAYLQVKKGSQAVEPLNESIRLDPIGKAEAHLRLAALYNAAGLKSKAAEEYEHFLAKKPDHPDRGRLLQYIREHKQPSPDPF